MLVAKFAEHGQKFHWRDVDSAPRLHRLDQNGTDSFASKQPMDGPFDSGNFTHCRRERHEMSKFTKLLMKRAVKKNAVRHIQCAVAKPVISTGKGDDPRLARGQHGGFQSRLDGFKTGIGKDYFSGGT